MPSERKFHDIAHSFAENMAALRVLNVEIGTHADQRDRSVVEKFMSGFFQLLEVDLESLRAEHMGRPAEAEVQVQQTVEQADVTSAAGTTRSKIHERFDAVLDDPAKLKMLVDMARESDRLAPMQGSLLRRGALTTLVSFFEALLADLIRGYYSRYPSALPQEAHALTLAELKTLGSLAEAETYILDREIEQLLRQTLSDQLKYVAGRLKVDLAPLDPYRDDLIEIWQRRNLVVHNKGIVNTTYLARVPSAFIQQHEVKEGTYLRTSSEYLSQAIETVYLAGAILLQQCWFKWVPTESSLAESHIVDQTFELLVAGRFTEARRFAEYARKLKFGAERHMRIVLVNLAIALKQLGHRDEMNTVLQSADWSAAALDFRVALHALRDEFDDLLSLIPKAVRGGDISMDNLREWPLFAELRTHERFSELMSTLET